MQPSGLLVTISMAMLALCLWGAGTALALLLARGDDYAYIFGAVLGGWSIWIGQLLYRSTFRHSVHAATACRVSLWLSAMFMAYLLIGCFVKGPDTFVVAGIISSLLSLFALSAWLQGNWIYRLCEQSARSCANRARSFSLGDLLISIAAIACLLGGLASSRRALLPRMGEHLRPDQVAFPLPTEARDVSYYSVGWYDQAYAFTIDESGFRLWAEQRGCPNLQPAGNLEWRRYFTHLRLPDFNRAPLSIADGLEGNDGLTHCDGVHVAFDRKSQRAFYFFSARRPD